MNKLYFVINLNGHFLASDGNFYPPFVKMPFGVNEATANKYAGMDCTIEPADEKQFSALYDDAMKSAAVNESVTVPRRRTYVRCSTFALAAALDRLCDSSNTRNVMLSMEDGDFLISFEYLREYERPSMKHSSGDTCAGDAKPGSHEE